MNKEKTIKLKVNNCTDRENMVIVLVNTGYKVRVVEQDKEHGEGFGTDYYVLFDYEDVED